ncbi:MAG: hypothetical protein KDD62_13730, partial [Bdellovibrionales bacterium]|nr:hypothetical protein [Bdellovibrionales bacterium]
MVKVLDPARVDATEQVASVPESNIDALRRENAPQDPVTVDPLSIITDSDSSHMQSHAALHQRQQRDRVVSTSAGRDVTRELAEQEAGLHSSSDRDVEEERIRSLVRSAVRPAQRTLSPDSLAQLENNIATKVSGANVNPAQLQAAMDAMSTRLEGDLVANLRMGDRSESEIVEELSELIIEALEEEGLVLEEARDEYTEEEVTPEQRISPAMQIQLERKAIVDAKVIAVTQALEAQEPLVAVGDVMRQLPADMHQEFLDAFREAQGQTLLSALDADPETERGIAAAQLVET